VEIKERGRTLECGPPTASLCSSSKDEKLHCVRLGNQKKVRRQFDAAGENIFLAKAPENSVKNNQ
jgi:hypothetical protein